MSPSLPENATDEQRAKNLYEKRRRRFLLQTGRPSMVSAAPAIAKVRSMYHDYEMTTDRIAELAHVHQSSVTQLIRGYRLTNDLDNPITKMHRSTANRILAVTPDPVAKHKGREFGYGVRVPSIGPRRRLQALYAVEFSPRFLADAIGLNRHDGYVNHWIKGTTVAKAWTYASTRDAIVSAYDKYRDVDPSDVGVTLHARKHARRTSDKHMYAPPHCWDDDLIDDPTAFPEWTGKCGSVGGMSIHRRLGTRYCVPCARAKYHSGVAMRRDRDGFDSLTDAEREKLKEYRLILADRRAKGLYLSESEFAESERDE